MGPGDSRRLDGLVTGVAGAVETGVDFVVTSPVRRGILAAAADRPLAAAADAEARKFRHWSDLPAHGYGFVPVAFEATGAFGLEFRRRVWDPIMHKYKLLAASDRAGVEDRLAPTAAFNGRSPSAYFATRIGAAVFRGVGAALVRRWQCALDSRAQSSSRS